MIDGMLRGAGAMASFMIATFTDLILRVILSYIMSASLGVTGKMCIRDRFNAGRY